MAAHDEKISANRRRLFKALSATPVVLTLRPGTALAQDSFQQCLDKHVEVGSDFIPLEEGALCNDSESCSAYVVLSYWEVPSAPVFGDLSDTVIVEVSDGVFLTTDRTDISDRVDKGDDDTLHILPDPAMPAYHGIMTSANKDDSIATSTSKQEKPSYHGIMTGGAKEVSVQSESPVPGLEAQQGYFKVYAGVRRNGAGDAIGIDLTTIEPYPQGPSTDDQQGLNHTCLMSVDSAAAQSFNFVKG